METLSGLTPPAVAFRVALALLFGGCIGLERGRHGRAAGLRTHILVCVGATLAALVGVYGFEHLNFNSDPLRVAAQVISGIGFLGVGIIIVKGRTRVTGLTTAAGLWATGSIGIAIGIGFYFAAFMAFLAVFITMTWLIRLEQLVKSKNYYLCYVECVDDGRVKELYHNIRPYASHIDMIPAKSGIANHIGFEFKADGPEAYEQLIQKAEEHDSVVIALPVQN